MTKKFSDICLPAPAPFGVKKAAFWVKKAAFWGEEGRILG
jgi:hypothetical protein